MPLKALDNIRRSIEKQEKLEADTAKLVKQLEDTPRHAISAESFQLAAETWKLKALRESIQELKQFLIMANTDFMTPAEVDQKLSGIKSVVNTVVDERHYERIHPNNRAPRDNY